MKLTDYKPETFKMNKDEINSLIIEQAVECAEAQLEAAHSGVEVTEIDPDGDGASTRYKAKYQQLFDELYDQEYDRRAALIGFDSGAKDGRRHN